MPDKSVLLWSIPTGGSVRHEDAPLRQQDDVPVARSAADGVDPAADHAAFQAAFGSRSGDGGLPGAPPDFIDDFVDLVGHHLRTPLTAIRTLLELLADDGPDGTATLDPATAKRLV